MSSLKKEQDSKVLELRQQLLDKEKSLRTAEKPNYLTSGLYRPLSALDRGSINIKSAKKHELIEAAISLNAKAKACKTLDLESETHLGYPIEDWITDLKTRIAVLNKVQTLQEVQALQAQLEPLLTPSQKREIGISDLSSKIQEVVK